MRSRSRGNSSSTRSWSSAIAGLVLAQERTQVEVLRTVIRGKIRRPSGDWAMPSRTISWAAQRSIALALEATCPVRGLSSPEIVRSVVDLPAPLEPIRVTISPWLTFSERPFTAAMLP